MKTNKTYNDALGWARRLYKDFLEIKRKTNAFVELDGLLERLEEGFPELKESEDEGVRKALLKLVSNDKNNGYTDFYKAEGITCDDAIAYLEKQKEQKPIKCIDFDNEFENQVSHLIASVLNGEHEYSEGFVKYAVQSLLGYAKSEMNPVEWSEEDEKMRDNTILSLQYLVDIEGIHEGFLESAEREIAWLKSLRPQPHWKPSEEQIEALEYFIRSWGESGTMSPQNPTFCAAKSLLHDLKQL